MKRNQWYVLSVASYLLGMLFVRISLGWKQICEFDVVNMMNIFSCIRGEIFAPYPYIFFALGFVFIILGFMEKEK